MFELFFKYSRATFERGEFVLASDWPLWLLGGLIALGAVVIAVTLYRYRRTLAPAKVVVLGVLQLLLWVGVLAMLWQPALITQSLRPQENSVAVLVDESASMGYGEGEQSRLELAIDALEREILPALSDSLTVETFAFTDSPRELDGFTGLSAAGTVTHVGEALLDVLRGSNAGGRAAIVLLSDGADNSGSLDAARIAEIASFGVPVHAIGVGRETIDEDIELEDVIIARQGPAGSTATAQVSVRHGRGGLAQLKVYDGDAILAAETIQLPDRPGVTTRRVDLLLGEVGVRDLRFTLDALPGERNVLNNTQLRPLEVPAQRRSILHIEGEPRWEYKFMRRALHEDSPLRVASLLRTTPNKFYRQGIEAPEELADGFPTDEETLFEYDALIIGSYEAAALTEAQHELIREFVSRRGGSLLMQGGRRGLGDGGWGITSVAEALPVELPEQDGPTFTRTPAKAELTEAGAGSLITRFEIDDRANAGAWGALPDLADYQTVGELKAGAELLLTVRAGGSELPLLVHQRYGLGNVYVLATGGTWRWQMQMPHENQQHETFWRQLLQALVTSAAQRITLTTDRAFYADDSRIGVRVELKDAAFRPTSDAEVSVRVTHASGVEDTVALAPVAGSPGMYTADYVADAAGIYRFEAIAKFAPDDEADRAETIGAQAEIEVGDADGAAPGAEAPADGEATADEDGAGELVDADVGFGFETAPAAPTAAVSDADEITSARVAVRREDGVAEHFRVQQNRPLLERIAAATNGRYFTLDDVDELPEAISYSEAGIVERQLLALWNMPILFLALLLLKAGEWLLRLRWGRL